MKKQGTRDRGTKPALESQFTTAARRYRGAAVVLAATAVAIAPQLVRGSSCGHDFDVHLVSWLDCADAWRHGILYPHWTASANYGAGEPRFVFYPPLTWMAGAALGMLFSWTAAPILLTFLILAGTGLATRALARELLDDAQATLAGCTAIFCGFTLFTAYERTAFPEFMGGVWLPLLVLFALRERRPEAKLARRALDGSAALLALMLAACWLSNAPLGVVASYLLAGVALVAAVARRSWAPLLRAAVAVLVGLCAIAFYWIPAKLEQSWVDIRQATEDPGYNFENNWAFARHSDPVLALHDQVLQQASWIAVAMIGVALLCAWVCWRNGPGRAARSGAAPALWMALAAVPAAVLFLLFPISRPVWNILPEFRFLQYPWRWLEAVEAPMAIFFAAAVWPRGKQARRTIAVLCVCGFLAATAYAGTHFFQVCYPEDTTAAVVEAHRAGTGFEGMYEYAPPGAELAAIATGLPDACLVADPSTVLAVPSSPDENPAWSTGSGVCLRTAAWASPGDAEHRTLRGTMPQGGYLVLRLLSFPAWQVRANGSAAASLPRRSDGLIAVPVEKGPLELTVDWTTTGDVRLSRWVSLLGVLALAGLAYVETRRAAPQVS